MRGLAQLVDQVVPPDRTDWLAGLEVAEQVATARQEGQDLALISCPELGGITPPRFRILHLIAAAVAAGIDDQGLSVRSLGYRVNEPGDVATGDRFAPDDARRRPGESVEKQLLAHPLLPTLAACCPLFRAGRDFPQAT
jgi:hypothetical protein